MSEEKTLTVTGSSALDIYGSGEDIKTLAQRIKLCLPNGDRLQNHEALALAQLSIAYDLNPFNGEAWYIPGKGPMVGIKGHRKAARRQAGFWIEHILLTSKERQELAIPDSAIAYKCFVYRTDMIRQSAEAIHLMHQAGMNDAAERYAYKPTIGVGFWTKGESTRMKPDQAARKRAEADALKQAFDLPFASEVGNAERVGYIDAEWEPAPAGAVDSDRVATTSTQLYGDENFEGFGDEPAAINVDTATGEVIDTPPPDNGPTWDAETVEAGKEDPPADEPASFTQAELQSKLKEVLTAVNEATGGAYNATSHLYQAMKKEHGEVFSWPSPHDENAWADIQTVLIERKSTD